MIIFTEPSQSNQLSNFIDENATSEIEKVGCSQINSNTKMFFPNKSQSIENNEDLVGQLSKLVAKDDLAHILNKRI